MFKIGDRVKHTTSGMFHTISGFNTDIDSKLIYIMQDGLEFYPSNLALYKESKVVPIKEDSNKEIPAKFDNGKSRTDLVRPEFILGLGEALAYGADKYSEPIGEIPNYLKGDGFNYSRIIGSLERHIQQWKSGENIDPESNIHHLKLASANLMFLLTYELSDKGVDDRVVLKKESDEEETSN